MPRKRVEAVVVSVVTTLCRRYYCTVSSLFIVTQNVACVIPATLSKKYATRREGEKEIERLVITFISLMNVPAIDRGGVGYGVNASTENGKLGMYKLAYEYSSTSAPGQT